MRREEKISPGSELALKLLEKYARAAERLRGLRRPDSGRVFERLAVIYPEMLRVQNYGRSRPLAAFNPAALLRGDRLLVYPRLVFDYYWYASSVGLFELSVQDLLESRTPQQIPVRIVLYPSGPEDLRGCEDPRAQEAGGLVVLLYTSVSPGEGGVEARQGVAVGGVDSFRKLGHLALEYAGKRYVTFWKDSALLGENLGDALVLIRPSIPTEGGGVLEVCWAARASIEELSVDAATVEPVLAAEDFEFKVGWSTNTLKVSSNEWLVGWHGVGRDYVYRNGLALVGSDGELLGVTGYLLEPRASVEEFYGDRPGVVFGCGLVRLGEKLLWVGGLSDYAIGVWAADTDSVFEHMKSIGG